MFHMRYDDASGAIGTSAGTVDARDDTDALAAGSRGPATGNTISGVGTLSGKAGADLASGNAEIIAVQGASGDSASGSGTLEVDGRYGTLNLQSNGNYNYMRNADVPDGVSDTSSTPWRIARARRTARRSLSSSAATT
jgi:hypothetical protein